MSEQSRALPNTPNLRFLKLEAKRRLAAGEFTSLHDAQLSIAREHGFSSWTALKLAVEGEPTPALSQVRWLVARFADARRPEWTAPDESEIRTHFHDRFLTAITREQLITTLRALALPEPAELTVKHASATHVRAQLGDLRIEAAAEAEPPHRFDALRIYPLGDRVTDPRVADPRTAVSGDVPVRAIELAGTSVAELGLPGLILAGGTEPWVLAHGWADLARHEPMRVDHRFPAYGITKLITATVVLRLVAAGRVDLDAPANSYLRSIRLADNAVTVKEILTHTGGVVGPSAQVVAVEQRGTFKPSNAGYAVLGQLVADVTGSSFPDVAGELVLTPLGMRDSTFPMNWPDSGALHGHQLAEDGTFEPTPQAVYEPAAAGGMWTTGADLLRFGNGWSTLLPAELAADAIRPHAAQRVPGANVGLGWLCNTAEGMYGHSGAGAGSASSLIVRAETGAVTVAVTNRLVPIEPVNAALSRPI
ncbi:MAG TPA: serine hydrolase domain-containing protein [Pseudonocardiaceae bacterium]|nr:serine hydrolase domain-containing protein [Pseudonocardiaceae bacterium]